MKRWVVAAVLAASVSMGALVAVSVRADDHATDVRTQADPASDITDLYAFMKPGNDAGVASDSVVLVMNVMPHTGQGAKFSDHVAYSFFLRRVVSTSPLTFDDRDVRVNCVFVDTTPQVMTCDVPGIGKQVVNVGDVYADAGGSGQTRLFAGERADTTFIDQAAVLASLDAGAIKFSSPGVNTYSGRNVLSIVVQTSASALFGMDAGVNPGIIAVSAQSSRN